MILIAQTSGHIQYTSTTKMDPERLKRIPESIRSQIPKEFVNKYELFYTDEESLYRSANVETEGDADIGRRGFRMRFGGRSENNVTYRQLKEKRMVSQREAFDKIYLLKEAPEYKWKVTGNKELIAGMIAMEATTMIDDTIPVAAYFSPQIPVAAGPGEYHGLPGLILKVDRNNGQTILIATEVGELTDASIIEEPTKGKETTREEFEEMRKKKMEEMREMRKARGGGPPGRGRG